MEIYDDLETDDKASVSVIDYENALRARPQVYERVAMAELGTIEEACSLAEKYEDILGETYDGSRHYNDQIRRNNYTSIVPRNERYSYNANFNNDAVNNFKKLPSNFHNYSPSNSYNNYQRRTISNHNNMNDHYNRENHPYFNSHYNINNNNYNNNNYNNNNNNNYKQCI